MVVCGIATMERLKAALLALSLLGAGAFGLAACEEKGPFERAGEAADETARDVGRAVEDATE
jgi:hypothetical protein